MPNQPSAARPPVLDLDHLRRQTLEDRALETELLTLFARQARRLLDDLAAVPAGDVAAPRHRADLLHTLCGSARAIGAGEVALCAEALERHQRAADRAVGGTAIDLPQLARAIARACDAIDRLGAAQPDAPGAFRPVTRR